MRMMLKLTIPVDKGNESLKDGSMQKILETAMSNLKPEASYFFPQDGQRTMLLFFDVAAASDIVLAVEPLWLALDADIELTPVMTLDDLMAGLHKMG